MMDQEIRTEMSLDTEEYKKFNIDLRGLSEEKLIEHFDRHGSEERRIFKKPIDMRDRMSMAWLRGKGLEIGAASNPTPLYGKQTKCAYLEPDESDSRDSKHTSGIIIRKKFKGVHYWGNIEEKNIWKKIPNYGEFDFCIALHVLEHANSMIRGIKNTIKATRQGGIVYLALPDKDYLDDKLFMKRHGVIHHSVEYVLPKVFLEKHKNTFRSVFGLEKYKQITEKETYLHRHSYDMNGYVTLLTSIKSISRYFGFQFEIKDIAYGYERRDINIILENKTH